MLRSKLKLLAMMGPPLNLTTYQLARHSKVPRAHILNWMERVDEYREAVVKNPNATRMHGGGKKILSPEMERQVMAYFVDQRRRNLSVNGISLRMKALSFTKTIKFTGWEDFKASGRWVFIHHVTFTYSSVRHFRVLSRLCEQRSKILLH